MSWASSMRPPTLQQARNQYPLADVITYDYPHKLILVEGSPSDWWHESKENYEFVRIMYITSTNSPGTLIANLAVDSEIKERIWNRSSGRWIFWTTKNLVVLLAFANEDRHVNFCRKLKGIHKSAFSFGVKWPSEQDVENLLMT